MKQLYEIKRKLSLLLLIGIAILCMSFIFINCGVGPQSKIINSDSGQFAVDCGAAPGGTVAGGEKQGCVIYFVSEELLNRQGPEVTVEAWVKRKTDSLTGFVVDRHATEGVVMWVKDNEPKFAITRIGRELGSTSTDFIVDSNFSLATNTWYHIAGVLTNTNEGGIHSCPRDVGQYTSIVRDSNDKLHISYYDVAAKTLRYSTNASGSWVNTMVDNSSVVGQYSSIAIDSSKIYISYYTEDAGNLKFASCARSTNCDDASEWTTTTVDIGDDSDKILVGDPPHLDGIIKPEEVDKRGRYTSIAVDSTKVHISYYAVKAWNDPAGNLIYASCSLSTNCDSASDWTITTVDSAGDVGQYSDIAVSSTTAHISYYDNTNKKLKYASCALSTNCDATGEWTTADVASSAGEIIGQYSSIAIESLDIPHISYYHSTSTPAYFLKHATNKTGTWVATTVDSTGNIGQHTSIAMDSTKAYISYYDVTNGDLKYASCALSTNCDSTGEWTSSTVDSTGDVGQFTSIALDSSSNAHISYYDVTNGDLKYATNTSGIWATTTLDDGEASFEIPHLDIYVTDEDGVGGFRNCASTGSRSMAVLTCAPQDVGAGSCEGDTMSIGGAVATGVSDGTSQSFMGVIDDVRYWTAARTQAQIQACMYQELVMHDSGDCGIDNSNLAAYVKLNEGKGSAPSDWTGLGSGSKENNGFRTTESGRFWDGGWVSGAPITRKD
jgi:hypothetical protein